ncbi:hypothetical protein EFR84_11620 [Rhizobium chutanense]|uniref:Uncharacterized protein n=1 Tax=Rhizobium chutanense TaxID=2035448 RepID=A0A3S0XX62_9HYPH|nr:hypothetical protein EFR84_11620 [Rhizobium chutanense]
MSLDQCCGGRPQAHYDAVSVISCRKCGETVTVETPPFFRSDVSQREHQTWRAIFAWKTRRLPAPAPDPKPSRR